MRHFYRKWKLFQGFGIRQKKRRGSPGFIPILRHFYRKWKLIQGFGNRKKKRRGSPGFIPILRHFYRKWKLFQGFGIRQKKRRGSPGFIPILRHFYRKWKLIQGFGNRKKNGVCRPPGCIPIFLDTFIENGNYFMDSETVKKKRRGSASRVYTYFLLTLLSKMEINSRSRKPSKKNGVGQPPGFIPICFETLLWKMETNSRIRKP